MVQHRRIAQTAMPKAALVERPREPLASFADRLGALLYGPSWKGEMLDELARLPPGRLAAGSNSDCAVFVRDQVLDGFRSAVLTAVVSLVVRPFAGSRSTLTGEDFDTASDVEMAYDMARIGEDDALLYDAGTPKQRWFTIDPSFWLSTPDPDIDWAGSTITVPSDALRDPSSEVRRTRPVPMDFDVPPRAARVPMHIREPDRALRGIFTYADAPDEDWLRRYKLYRGEGRLEALAAAWRYLAVTGLNSTPPSAAELGREMQRYLEAQGLNPSRTSDGGSSRNSGLQDMATRVLRQLEHRDVSSSVLVPGNPRRQKLV